jgi:uncharacterized membrane protein YesL
MITTYERELEERKIIKKETRISMLVGIAAMISTAIYALLAKYITIDLGIAAKLQEDLYGILVLVIILIMIGILAVRKTIYYSPKLIKDEFNLTQILEKWRMIDIILIAVAETIPLLGLIITWLGLPFDRTWFIFLTAGILMIILMPMSIKVRSKLSILRKQHPNI